MNKESLGSWQDGFETCLTKSNFFLGHSQVRRGLARWPAVTNALTYGTLFCTAELTQQLLIKKYLPYKEVIKNSQIVDKTLVPDIFSNHFKFNKYNWKSIKHTKIYFSSKFVSFWRRFPVNLPYLLPIGKANIFSTFAKIETLVVFSKCLANLQNQFWRI